MVILLAAALLLLFLVGSGVFSGSETGLYSLARLRVEAGARAGLRSARIIERLQRDETGILVTILIGTNLCNLLASHTAGGLVAQTDVPPRYVELVETLCLSPLLFFFGELFPKDLFHRRPHVLMGYCAPIIAGAKVLFLPLALPLHGLSRGLERLLGLKEHGLAGVQRREAVLDLVKASSRAPLGQVESMARNVLGLRGLSLERVMVPWRRVSFLVESSGQAELLAAVRQSRFSRLPLVTDAGEVRGYVHQLDVLGQGASEPVLGQRRPLLALPSDLSPDRALVRLRGGGQRMALVGEPEAPLGLVTLKDLVEEISGELTRW